MSVSVITPMYNEAMHIERCYRSLCEQSDMKFEWVVVDDGSTDMSIDVIKKLIAVHDKENFTITLIEQDNAGAAAARQNGISQCKFDIITILDADDQLSENALARAFAKMTGSVDIVCYQVHFVDENKNVLSAFNYMPSIWPVSGQEAFSQCIDDWGLTGWFMVKKEVILNAYKYINALALGNTINLDEFVSRLSMFYARQIDICSGIYLYFNNQNSTTKKVNLNYYKIIFTALELNRFIIYQNNPEWYSKSQCYLFSVCWGVHLRYFKWKSHLGNKACWLRALKTLANDVNISEVLNLNLTLKEKLKVSAKAALVMYLRYKPMKGIR